MSDDLLKWRALANKHSKTEKCAFALHSAIDEIEQLRGSLAFYDNKCEKCGDHLGLLAECPHCRDFTSLRAETKQLREALSRIAESRHYREGQELCRNIAREALLTKDSEPVVPLHACALCERTFFSPEGRDHHEELCAPEKDAERLPGESQQHANERIAWERQGPLDELAKAAPEPHGIDDELRSAINILCAVHTDDDHEIGFRVRMGATPDGSITNYMYVMAWATLRKAIGRQTA